MGHLLGGEGADSTRDDDSLVEVIDLELRFIELVEFTVVDIDDAATKHQIDVLFLQRFNDIGPDEFIYVAL